MKGIALLLLISMLTINLPVGFEGFIVYETVDNKNGLDTMIEYYSQNRLLNVYKVNNALSKHLILPDQSGQLTNYVQDGKTKKWSKFILNTSNIERPVSYYNNDSLVILNYVCRALVFKPVKSSIQSVNIIKSTKSYLSDNLFFYLNADSTDALNRIQLYREIKISSTNGAYDNMTKRKAIQIVHMKPEEKLFEVPTDSEINPDKN